jgi:hypothetical protein
MNHTEHAAIRAHLGFLIRIFSVYCGANTYVTHSNAWLRVVETGVVCVCGTGAIAVVSTVVGGGVGTFVDGTGFNGPICLTVDASSNIFVSNLYENKIRKVTPAGGAHASIELVCLSRVERKVLYNHSSVIRCSCFKM